MSRADWEARERLWSEQDAEDRILRDVEGDPPPLVKTGKLGPARARLANYVAWRTQYSEQLGALLNERKRLAQMLDAPAQTQGRIADLIARPSSRAPTFSARPSLPTIKLASFAAEEH